ncbi:MULTISPECIES: suppressor of fused domain protein [unclassified Actinotalea]|uniref:suppressor of fused domain protein n=1 Tax=unclassified Actinotalea TaxID=2638618 RepID=UPI0015F4CE02|nr:MULTISPECIES: suppressor of fused domain protein [unclassified Actinotalea]
MDETLWRLGLEAAIERCYGDSAPVAVVGIDRASVPWDVAPMETVLVHSRDLPVPHWHYIGLGLTAPGARAAPAGVAPTAELTFRLERHAETQPPRWPLDLLHHVATYLAATGELLGPGHTFDLNAPVTPDAPSPLRHLLFAPDPDLGDAFLQAVGITSDELAAHERWSGFRALLDQHLPMLVTAPRRTSTLALPGVAAQVEAGSEVDGSERVALVVSTLEVARSARLADRALGRSRITVTLSTHPVDGLRRALLDRVARGAAFMLRGPGTELLLVPQAGVGPLREEPSCWVVGLSPEQAASLADTLAPVVGTYRSAALPAVTFDIRPSAVTQMPAPEADPAW